MSGAANTQLRAYSVGPAPASNTRRLHLNEFRFSHSSHVLKVLGGALGDAFNESELLTNYQAGQDRALSAAIAHYAGAPSEAHVLIAAGSDEVLRAILDTCGHKTLLMGVPSYTHFEHNARLRGMEIVAYPIGLGTPPEDHLMSLEYYSGLLQAGCLVYLCSPNNPTGDLWSGEVVGRLARLYPASLFVVDEAYIEFASVVRAPPGDADPQTPRSLANVFDSRQAREALNFLSASKMAFELDNVVVTRTMSKAFGLAALRVGYALATPGRIRKIAVAVSPKAMNPIAAPVACAALESLGHYWLTTREACREAERAVAALRKSGWYAVDTPGNFYLVYVGHTADAVRRLADAGVQARDRGELPGLSGFIRLTAGTRADSDAVLSAFADLAPVKQPPIQTFYTPKGKIAQVKGLMKQTFEVLQKNRVVVFAQGGTMLGMFRHRGGLFPGGAIPWDDDGDLAYVLGPDGPDPLADLVDTFRREGLTLQRNRTDAYWQVGTNAPGTVISPVHVDIFSYARVQEKPGGPWAYVLGDPRFRDEDPGSLQAHCNTKYADDELFPLDDSYRFYDLPIPMPAKSGAVLRRALGEDFMVKARVRTGDGLVEYELADTTPA